MHRTKGWGSAPTCYHSGHTCPRYLYNGLAVSFVQAGTVGVSRQQYWSTDISSTTLFVYKHLVYRYFVYCDFPC